MSRIGVTAHRGCKGYIPENTLISFKEALDLKVDVLEYDVHMCLDGELIIMHDSLAVRTTGAKGSVVYLKNTVKNFKTKGDAGTSTNPQKASARMNPQKASARNR